jgi:hypothetical protein
MHSHLKATITCSESYTCSRLGGLCLHTSTTIQIQLMASDAIYEDDLAVFENKGGLCYFQLRS